MPVENRLYRLGVEARDVGVLDGQNELPREDRANAHENSACAAPPMCR